MLNRDLFDPGDKSFMVGLTLLILVLAGLLLVLG